MRGSTEFDGIGRQPDCSGIAYFKSLLIIARG